ncbi:hydroxyacylglutathione hydrolase [Acetoanaerobium pronyense]|uniref:Hydroxyacylglutathione hydrolase n=1 Tax=Acetoanaerobium pronyense TaxID=1482736 RepID=A0ABS4KK60_9FIRM|nr:MBL fold metallo-hydrolase [Acetoanaerobium pronyense]MBP2027511.1 hydroxyacylglutathione hydrolase [Acetoanaerobium pronyense]
MFFKRFFTKGLAHYSYMIGDGDSLVVIDPMTDVSIYVEQARKANMKITHIFETHRNEDYIVGSLNLSKKTNADIYISKYENLGYEYGTKIGEEDIFEIGDIKIKPIHTPGHTKGHLAFLVTLKDENYMFFTGDALFFGDIGRTDFYGEENLEEMTGKLYDSIFEKLFPLGNHVLLFPAHGAGSACGGSIEEREFSTLGYERLTNQALNVSSKEEFIKKHGYMRLKPPYFEKMEIYNVKGYEDLNEIILNPFTIESLSDIKDKTIIDIRDNAAFVGKHMPNSIYFGVDNLSAYLGWLIGTEETIYFMADNLPDDIVKFAYLTTRRIGFENIGGVLGSGTIDKLENSGQALASIDEISAKDYFELCQQTNITVLDVRKDEELLDEDPVENRIHIPLQLLNENMGKLKGKENIVILCGSGERATIASSYLKKYNIDSKVIAGGIQGLNSLR